MKFGSINLKEHVPTGGRVHLEADEERRDVVRDAFKWSYDAYGEFSLQLTLEGGPSLCWTIASQS